MKYFNVKLILIMAVTISLLLFNFIKATSSDYQHTARNVLDFFNDEQKLKHLSIVTFDSNKTNVKRMIYHFASSRLSSKEMHYFSVYHSPSTLQHSISSHTRKDGGEVLHDNVLVITTFQSSNSWEKILNLLVAAKVESSIMMFVGKFEAAQSMLFTNMLDNLSKNSMFYLAHQNQYRANEILWYRVTTLTGYKNAIVHQLGYDSDGKVLKNYDMQGLHVVSITESWAPYFSLLDCTPDKRNCRSEGYLTDVMNILGTMMNFTWESHGEIDGNWGTTPISGPSNSSGIWGGVTGNVYNGTYQLSISTWIWNEARNDMFDYIPVVTDRMVLAIMKNSIRRSPLDLYFRPLAKNVWITMGAISVVIAFFLLSLFYLRKHVPDLNTTWNKTKRIIVFIAWACFLLIEVHFEGTLIMFLTTEIEIPFHSIKEVMQDYPKWRLLMRTGFEVHYYHHVEAGDKDYIKFWDRVQSEPKENTYVGIDDVLNHYQNDPVVIHDLEGAIDAHSKYEDGSTMEHLTIFNKGRTEWYGIIVTENSPLGPMLAHGSKDMRERGVFNYLQKKWLKSCRNCRPIMDHTSANMVLDLKQVSFLFLILGNAMIISLIILLLESRKSYQKNELIVVPSVLNNGVVDREKCKKGDQETQANQEYDQNIKKNIFDYVWNM